VSGMLLADGDSVNTNTKSRATIVSEDGHLLMLDERTAALIQGAYYPCPPSLVIKLKPQEVKTALAPPSPGTDIPNATVTQPMVRGTAFLVLPTNLPVCLTLTQENQAPTVPAPVRRTATAGISPCDQEPGGAATRQTAEVPSRTTDAGWNGLRDAFRPVNGMSLSESLQRWVSEESIAGAGIGLEGATYPFFVWSEALRLRLAGQDAPGLYSLYLERHFLQVRNLMKQGKADLAEKILTQTISGLDGRLTGPDAQIYRSGIRAALGKAAFAADDADSNFLPMRQRLEEAYVRSWSGDPRDEALARALLTDARLSQAEKVVCDPWYTDPLAQPVGSAEQAFNRLAAEAASGAGDKVAWSPVSDLVAFERTRLVCLQDYLKSCHPKPGETRPKPSTLPQPSVTAPTTQPPVFQPPVTQPTGGNQDRGGGTGPQPQPETQPTAPVQPEVTTPVVVPEVRPEPSIGLAFIMISAQPNPARVGDSVDLSVKGVLNDGSQLDVTAKATFSLSGNTGTLSGHIFQITQSGATTITATVTDGGRDFTDSVMLNVIRPGSSPTNQFPGTGGMPYNY